MSVLHRWGKLQHARGSVVVFITRNLKRDALGCLYDSVDNFSRDTGAKLIVVPCDELGVCLEYREIAEGVRTLPAHFVGIRPWLRRKLCARYECRPDDAHADVSLNASFEALQVAEARLRIAEEMFSVVAKALADIEDHDERLREARTLLDEARDAYRTALSRYYGSWLASRRISATRTFDDANPEVKDPSI